MPKVGEMEDPFSVTARRRRERDGNPEPGTAAANQRFQEKRAERKARRDRAMALKSRASQIQAASMGPIGAAIINPSGGIAGPQHVGRQLRFGGMSRGAAINQAVNEQLQQDRLNESMERTQDAEQKELVKFMAEQGDPEAMLMLRETAGMNVDEADKAIAGMAAQGKVPAAPQQTQRLVSTPVDEREQMAFQVEGILNRPSSEMTDDMKRRLILQLYSSLNTEQGITDLQDNTSYDKLGPGDYLLSERLRKLFGLKKPPGLFDGLFGGSPAGGGAPQGNASLPQPSDPYRDPAGRE
jgi:hypothetical protein